MCDDGVSSEVRWACPTWNPKSAERGRQSVPEQMMDSFVGCSTKHRGCAEAGQGQAQIRGSAEVWNLQGPSKWVNLTADSFIPSFQLALGLFAKSQQHPDRCWCRGADKEVLHAACLLADLWLQHFAPEHPASVASAGSTPYISYGEPGYAEGHEHRGLLSKLLLVDTLVTRNSCVVLAAGVWRGASVRRSSMVSGVQHALLQRQPQAVPKVDARVR